MVRTSSLCFVSVASVVDGAFIWRVIVEHPAPQPPTGCGRQPLIAPFKRR
jgi:hypothetical protein